VSSLVFGLGWARHWQWYALFATNIGDALGQSGHDSLNVLWSLAVEEQFYIVWPFVVLLLPQRALAIVAAALIVLVPLLRAVATPWFDTFWPIYYLTPFRMDLLSAGALLAVAVRRDRNALEPFRLPAVFALFAALVVLGWLHLHLSRREYAAVECRALQYLARAVHVGTRDRAAVKGHREAGSVTSRARLHRHHQLHDLSGSSDRALHAVAA
jgi:peptidoglycan/LPS O-acetylase OafA/YrhL